MNIRVAIADKPGDIANMDVEDEATPLDVLDGLKAQPKLGIDPAQKRYIVALRGRNLNATETMQAAGVKDGDLLNVIASSDGYLI